MSPPRRRRCSGRDRHTPAAPPAYRPLGRRRRRGLRRTASLRHRRGRAAAHRVFRHGVASGDPRPRSVILWTRVTPTDAATPGSGPGPPGHRPLAGRQGLALPATSSRTAPPRPARPRPHGQGRRRPGWQPATRYFYRFLLDGVASRTGRTRTAPAPTRRPRAPALRRRLLRQPAGRLLLAVPPPGRAATTSTWCCTSATTSTSTARRVRLRPRRADIRPHAPGARDGEPGRLPAAARAVQGRPRPAGACTPSSRSSSPGTTTRSPTTSGATAPRTTSPTRATTTSARPGRTVRTTSGCRCAWAGPRSRRRHPAVPAAQFGQLAELSMLDLRSYRSQQVERAATPGAPPDPEISDPDRTITGNRQMEWLKESLEDDRALWKLVGNPVMIAPVVFPPLPTELVASTTSPGSTPRTGCPTTSTSGTATPPTGTSCSSTCATRACRTRCSSPATSTPPGRATCPWTPAPTPPSDRSAPSSCAPA